MPAQSDRGRGGGLHYWAPGYTTERRVMPVV